MDIQFEWEEVDAFVRQPDGALFNWGERFCCYHHLIYGIVSNNKNNPLFPPYILTIYASSLSP